MAPPYSFTNLPAYAFDQVLSFTNMNILRLNQENTKDSYSEEHNYTTGEHGRIKMGQNLIINPTARRGNAFWWDGGVAADYDNPGTDTNPKLNYGAANFDYYHWTLPVDRGAFWELSSFGVFTADLSEEIVSVASTSLVLSAEIWISGYVAGKFLVDVVCYDSSDQLISVPGGTLNGLCQIELTADTVGGFVKFEATGTVPANTAYVEIRKWVNVFSDATLFRVRSVKLERGTIATTYSDESSMPQYLSARYTKTSDQAGLGAGSHIIDYDSVIARGFDDPGTNRVTTGGAWKFTADRYMKLRVSTRIEIEPDAAQTWTTGDRPAISLHLNGASYARLDSINLLADFNGGTEIISLQGSTIIELVALDYIDIRIAPTSTNNITVSGGATGLITYIDIEEIS